MKNLKLSLLSLFAFAIMMTSCNQNDVSPVSDGEQAVLDLVFLATGNDSTAVEKKDGHSKCNMTEVAAADLPASITTYISTAYDGSSIKRAGTNDTGEFFVLVAKSDGTYVGVKFDAAGAFVSERVKEAKSHGTKVAAADLPAAITTYITANYAGATVKGGRLSDDGSYGVAIQLADESYKGLKFDAAGVFVAEMTFKGKGSKRGK